MESNDVSSSPAQEDSKKYSVKHGNFGKTQGSATLSPPVGNIHLHERDGSTIGITKSSNVFAPMSLYLIN